MASGQVTAAAEKHSFAIDDRNIRRSAPISARELSLGSKGAA
jgi:hypothetical protein